MIPQVPLRLAQRLLRRVRMHQRRQRAAPDRQPGNEGSELCRSEEVDLEHGHGVRADGLVPYLVDAELGELAADALPELVGVEGLGGILGEVVYVDVTEVEAGVSDRGDGEGDREEERTSRLFGRYLGVL